MLHPARLVARVQPPVLTLPSASLLRLLLSRDRSAFPVGSSRTLRGGGETGTNTSDTLWGGSSPLGPAGAPAAAAATCSRGTRATASSRLCLEKSWGRGGIEGSRRAGSEPSSHENLGRRLDPCAYLEPRSAHAARKLCR